MDFNIIDYGNDLYTLDPITDEAKTWIHSTISDPIMWGNGVIVESSKVTDIHNTLIRSGFKVERIPW